MGTESKDGLRAMAQLRVYYCNGGHIEVKHLKSTKEYYRPSKKGFSKGYKSI